VLKSLPTFRAKKALQNLELKIPPKAVDLMRYKIAISCFRMFRRRLTLYLALALTGLGIFYITLISRMSHFSSRWVNLHDLFGMVLEDKVVGIS
jgi:hypothetical protein